MKPHMTNLLQGAKHADAKFQQVASHARISKACCLSRIVSIVTNFIIVRGYIPCVPGFGRDNISNILALRDILPHVDRGETVPLTCLDTNLSCILALRDILAHVDGGERVPVAWVHPFLHS